MKKVFLNLNVLQNTGNRLLTCNLLVQKYSILIHNLNYVQKKVLRIDVNQ